MQADITLERSLPCNLEAERAVLGAVLLDDKSVHVALSALRTEDFYLESHRRIFGKMTALAADGAGIDMVILKNALQRADEIEAAGGAAYLSNLTEGLPRAINLEHYAGIVREKSMLRRLIQLNNETMARAYQDEEVAIDLLRDHEQRILEIAAGRLDNGLRPVSEWITEAYREIEEASARKSAVVGLETGFVALDRMTGGLMPQDLVIVAARPGLGKTSICLNIACHAGIRRGKKVAIFSLEMAGRQLAKLRMLASEAEVDASKIKTGFLNRDDWAKLGRAAGAISQARIWIDDSPSLKMLDLRSRAQRLAMKQDGLDLVIIDYMQLMAGSEKRYENRTQEVTSISRGCKTLAKELGCPVIAISQLNRDSDRGGKPRRPQLSDLRESGAIEQDADLVLFIWREQRQDEEDSGTAEIIIGKQRNGCTGSFNLAFMKQYTKFADLYSEPEQGGLY